MKVVTLLTDFGLTDPFVGQMKAALLRTEPDLALVDLTHGIARGNIREGAWILRSSWELFPSGACHLAVVDPGVGGERRALAACAGGHFFVGPDNGLLVPALETAGEAEIREITVRQIDWPRRGTTFDGRDVFAPVAARLVSGVRFDQLGPLVSDPVPQPPFGPRRNANGWELEIVRVDHYGNLVTVGDEPFLRRTLGEGWRDLTIAAGDRSVRGVKLAYEDVDPGEAVLTIGSSGTLEVGVNGGSAAAWLGLEAGGTVQLLSGEPV